MHKYTTGGRLGVSDVERNRKRERNIGQRIAPFQEKLCESWNPAGDSQARALREAERQT